MAGSLNYGYVNAFMETVSAVTADPSVELGARRIENSNEYVYAYNSGSQDATVGYGVICSGLSAFSMSLSSALGDQIFGVVQSAAIPTSSYGWLLSRGVCTVVNGTCDGTHVGEGGITGGTPVVLGEMGKFFMLSTGATNSTWPYSCGQALETIVSGSSGKAYINCDI